jgi:hypothetical protein
MPFTHRVRRPWSGVKSGDLVDARLYRNLAQLERQHYIEPLTEKELAEMATHGPTDHVDGSTDEPRVPPARTDVVQPPPAQVAPPEQPAVEATREAVRETHPLTHHPDDEPAKPANPKPHPLEANADDAPAKPTDRKHPLTDNKDDEPARMPNTDAPGQNQQPPRRGPAEQSDSEADQPAPPAMPNPAPRGPYRRRQIPE